MIVAESTYLFALPGLAHLSMAIGATDFKPGPVQQLVLQRAIQLLDMELHNQATERPEWAEAIVQLLTDHLD